MIVNNLMLKLKDRNHMDKYLSHPVHLEVAQFVAGVLDTQASVCCETK